MEKDIFKEGRQKDKEDLLKMIEREKGIYITDNESKWLAKDNDSKFIGLGMKKYNRRFLGAILLENKFTDLVNKLLDEDNINVYLSDNLVNFICLSVRIKMYRLMPYESEILNNIFSLEEKNNYNSKEAINTINRIISKRKQAYQAENNFSYLKLIK